MNQNIYQACLIEVSQDFRLGQTNKTYLISPENSTVLGRAVNCEIAIDSSQYQSVSRRHAEIRPMASKTPDGSPMWQLCDLESVNGTYVNDRLLKGCQTLKPGDRISLGRTGPLFIFDWHVNYQKISLTQARKLTQTDSVHLTQLIPILSSQQDLLEKAYLLPGLITVLVVIALFASLSLEDPEVFNNLLGIYLAGACFYYVYRLGGKHKPWWLLLASALITIAIITTPTLNLFISVFRNILPGQTVSNFNDISFVNLFVRMFFGAGLMEELIKAVPVFIFLLLGRMLKSPWREAIGVWEPLDGILIATASAAGFTLIETNFHYVPDLVQTLKMDGNYLQAQAENIGTQLLIPRIIGSVAGHMAYSGYFGYFIGFSVLKPKKRWLLLAIGYLTSSAIHALWNASNAFHQPWNIMVMALAGVFAYLFLVAAILKARQISPTRSQNFATRLGRPPNW